MNRLLVTISLVFLVFSAPGQNHQAAIIDKANQAYNEGAFQESAELYQSVIDSGFVSADLYYNLGNAFFKSKDIPSAILNYEKALKINPQDDQTLFNLNIANSQITDKIEAVPEMFYIKWWKSFTGLFNPDSWAILSITLFILAISLVAVFIITRNITMRRIAFWSGLVIIIVMFVSFYISYQKYDQQNKNNFAIIFTPTITVKSSPAKNSVDLFVIHEGTKVEIMDQVEGWYEIRIANGSIGWLPDNTLKKI